MSSSRTVNKTSPSSFRCSGCGAINRVKQQPAGKRPICGRCKATLDTSGKPQEVDGKKLDLALRTAPIPVLVDFWAPWCGPCRMVAPVLEAIAKQRAGRLLILKVNSDDNQSSSRKHAVSGIPAMILFNGGREVARQTGALPQSALEAWLDSAS